MYSAVPACGGVYSQRRDHADPQGGVDQPARRLVGDHVVVTGRRGPSARSTSCAQLLDRRRPVGVLGEVDPLVRVGARGRRAGRGRPASART